nr:death-associated protein kinase 1 [Quercus suber]
MTSNLVPSNSDRTEEDVYREIKSGQWDSVVNDYEKNFRWVHSAGLIKMLGGTALHLAVSDGVENIVEKLVTIICKKDEQKKVLKIKNKQGNTPLHVAASTGGLRMCICIAKANPSLGNERNKEGESPLFLAALLGRTDIFLCLHYICKSKLYDSYYRKNGGETILHGAIKRECWDLAYQILDQEEQLATFMDERGTSPLHLLADKPSAFKSGCRLGWWSSIIYYCIAVDAPKRIDPRRLIKKCTEEEKKHKFIQSLLTMIRVGKKADEENPEGSNVSPKSRHEDEECNCRSLAESEDHKHYSFWKYCLAPFMIVIFVGSAILRILGFGEIKKIKKTHMLSDSIMNTVIGSTIHGQYFHRGTNPLLTEDKDEFMIIEDDMEDTEYRQTQVYELFRKRNFRKESMFQKLDKKGNSALHLAATLGEQTTGLIPGAALQMQWEIKWYEHIKNSMPPGFLHLSNNDGKTPGEIFMDTHKNLVEEGGKWLSHTSNACSIVAGLFVTVAFNMSTTVPGDVDDNGYPRLEKQLAFNIFAISSYISFYSSLLAVIMFLAILTSGYKESSFRSTLPMKLLLALTAFYVSIASTAISFSAAHFFILRERLKSAAFPSYSWAVLLLIFFAIAGFPLYFHLTWAIFKKVPHHHHMITPASFHIKH